MQIQSNIKKIHDEICAAAQKSGQDSSQITLIAVSKRKPAEMIQFQPKICVVHRSDQRHVRITVFAERYAPRF